MWTLKNMSFLRNVKFRLVNYLKFLLRLFSYSPTHMIRQRLKYLSLGKPFLKFAVCWTLGGCLEIQVSHWPKSSWEGSTFRTFETFRMDPMCSVRPNSQDDIVKWTFLNMGLSRPLFGFIFTFSWYIVSLQLIIFTMVNDDRKHERRRKSMHHSITRY